MTLRSQSVPAPLPIHFGLDRLRQEGSSDLTPPARLPIHCSWFGGVTTPARSDRSDLTMSLCDGWFVRENRLMGRVTLVILSFYSILQVHSSLVKCQGRSPARVPFRSCVNGATLAWKGFPILFGRPYTKSLL